MELESDENQERNSDTQQEKVPTKEESNWYPLKINAIIFAAYSLILLAAALNSGAAFLVFGIVMVLQALFNGLMFIVFLFIDIKKAAMFLLSGILVLVIGFSICGGIGFGGFENSNRQKENHNAWADSMTAKHKSDSVILAHHNDSINKGLKYE
jgi:hypothetical protein